MPPNMPPLTRAYPAKIETNTDDFIADMSRRLQPILTAISHSCWGKKVLLSSRSKVTEKFAIFWGALLTLSLILQLRTDGSAHSDSGNFPAFRPLLRNKQFIR